jgi:hypothetical protein
MLNRSHLLDFITLSMLGGDLYLYNSLHIVLFHLHRHTFPWKSALRFSECTFEANLSAGTARGTYSLTTRVTSVYTFGPRRAIDRLKGATNHKQNIPRSQQMPEIVPVVMHAL